jgi:hypothetical protein
VDVVLERCHVYDLEVGRYREASDRETAVAQLTKCGGGSFCGRSSSSYANNLDTDNNDIDVVDGDGRDNNNHGRLCSLRAQIL